MDSDLSVGQIRIAIKYLSLVAENVVDRRSRLCRSELIQALHQAPVSPHHRLPRRTLHRTLLRRRTPLQETRREVAAQQRRQSKEWAQDRRQQKMECPARERTRQHAFLLLAPPQESPPVVAAAA